MTKTILVVEDEKALSRAVKNSLEKNGFAVKTATTVEESLNIMKDSGDIDGVWLDHYLLGSLTGLDFLGELRANMKWAEIPVFVVTNSVDDDKRLDYELFGINKYFVKSNTSLVEIVNYVKEVV